MLIKHMHYENQDHEITLQAIVCYPKGYNEN